MADDNSSEMIAVYLSLMKEIKERFVAMGQIHKLAGDGGIEYQFSLEFAYLQLRLSYESVALACIAAHNDLAQLRRSRTFDNYKPQILLDTLESLHPRFFPIATTSPMDIPDGTGRQTVGDLPKEDSMTKDELIRSWNTCGDNLHRGKFKKILSDPEPTADFREVTRMHERLKRLITSHRIPLIGRQDCAVFTLSGTATDPPRFLGYWNLDEGLALQ
jgi:hypothetical protein